MLFYAQRSRRINKYFIMYIVVCRRCTYVYVVCGGTRSGATLSISASRNLRQQNLPDAAHRWTLVRPAWTTPCPFSLPPGTDIDYEIAPDKANEIPPRRAWLVVPSCSRERVSLIRPGCWLPFRAYRHTDASISLTAGENIVQFTGIRVSACSFCVIRHAYSSLLYGKGWCNPL